MFTKYPTSAPVADMFTVFARTGDDALSVFLVERDAAGLAVGRAIGKAGVRALVTSELAFDRTPATCLLGEPHRGMDYLREVLSPIRVMTAALGLGVARAALGPGLAQVTAGAPDAVEQLATSKLVPLGWRCPFDGLRAGPEIGDDRLRVLRGVGLETILG